MQPFAFGVVLAHEHAITRPPADLSEEDLWLDNPELSTAELTSYREAGGSAIAEMTTVDYGRDLAALATLSRRSGVGIVAATGFNKAKFADRFTTAQSVAEIAGRMISEIRGGDGAVRAGMIKAASSLDGAGENELKVFEAAAAAHGETGAPISTHTEKGTWALEQVALLTSRGVAPSSILVGHLDFRADLSSVVEVAKSGVFVGLDQFGKDKYLPDAERVRFVLGLVDAGYLHQIVISGDMARRSSLRAYGGGPGFTHIPIRVRSMLIEAGLSTVDVEQILLHNPSRFLAFDPA